MKSPSLPTRPRLHVPLTTLAKVRSSIESRQAAGHGVEVCAFGSSVNQRLMGCRPLLRDDSSGTGRGDLTLPCTRKMRRDLALPRTRRMTDGHTSAMLTAMPQVADQ